MAPSLPEVAALMTYVHQTVNPGTPGQVTLGGLTPDYRSIQLFVSVTCTKRKKSSIYYLNIRLFVRYFDLIFF
jgi:hypothetical protein